MPVTCMYMLLVMHCLSAREVIFRMPALAIPVMVKPCKINNKKNLEK